MRYKEQLMKPMLKVLLAKTHVEVAMTSMFMCKVELGLISVEKNQP